MFFSVTNQQTMPWLQAFCKVIIQQLFKNIQKYNIYIFKRSFFTVYAVKLA